MKQKPEELRIEPKLYDWVIKRAKKSIAEIKVKKDFKNIEDWIAGNSCPTFIQLENLAKFLYVPFGYLFFKEPPEEPSPLTDFRTPNDDRLEKYSVGLLETIYQCKRFQSWYSDYARENHLPLVPHLKSVTINDDPIKVAQSICHQLNISYEDRKKSKQDDLKYIVSKVEEAGNLVMMNSIVKNNTKRPLDHNEFKGFSLHDDFAPLIFINSSDPKESQVFTIAHEIAHLWLGESGLSDTAHFSKVKVERWCNQVATEIIFPKNLINNFNKSSSLDEINKFSKKLNLSPLVVLRRLNDSKFISNDEFENYYDGTFTNFIEKKKKMKEKKKGGPLIYDLIPLRLGRSFTKAVIIHTLEGKTLYHNAFDMLGVNSTTKFNNLAKKMELIN